jgi:hypothetical protein
MLTKIPIRPGIVKDEPDYTVEGRWSDADKVRFWRGRAEKIGGWRRFISDQLSGKCRGAMAWRSQAGDIHIAFGTTAGCFVVAGGAMTDISPAGYVSGNEYGAVGGGWGTGEFSGDFEWGAPTNALIDPRTWDFAAWGERLLAVYPDGGLYQWNLDTNSNLTLVGGAPNRNGHMFVTAEKFAVLLGTVDVESGVFDPMCIRWSDQDNYSNYTISHTTVSGQYRLAVGSQIVAGAASIGQSLVWTDAALYAMRYKYDIDFVYGFDLLGTNCGLIGPNAWAEKDGRAFWMSNQHQFYVFEGGAPRALDCPLRKFVFDNLNPASAHQVECGINSLFNEVWWLYAELGSSENNRYVAYSFGDGPWPDDERWTIGTIDRTAWVDAGDGTKPVAVSSDGSIYVHEDGVDADGEPLPAYVESASFDIGDGDTVMNIHRIVPDVVLQGVLDVTLKAKRWPNASWEVDKTRTLSATTNTVDIRAQGRQAKLRFATDDVNEWFRLGDIRIDLTEGGRR